MEGRRDAFGEIDTTVSELVGRKRGKAARKRARYPSEANRLKATWDLSPELVERIRAVSEELGVAQYSLVEKLLRYGLDQVEAGELELRKVAMVTTWGLE